MATISARAELAQFMVERLAELDPTLATTAGSRIYTVVINPLLNRLGEDPLATDMESFILARMRDVYPDIDINSPGSVVRDIFVNPLLLLMTPLREEIAHLRRQQSLADYTTLSDVEMDALLSNVLASRNTGSFAYGTIRVFFSTTRVVGVDASILFTTSAGQVFVADETRQFLPSEMVRQGNLWYIEVAARSQTPSTSSNVAAGTPFTVTGIDGVVRAANPTAISGGVDSETNTQFYERALTAITERSLNTERGIQSFIFDNSTNIVSVDVVGFGDPLMQRDILTANAPVQITGVPGGVPFPAITGVPVTVNPNQVHIGGATDIYVKTGQTASNTAAGLYLTSDNISGTVKTISITAGSNVVTSTGLGTLLGFSIPGVSVIPSGTYTLELENLDASGISPLAVKIVAATGANTVRVDSAFAGFAGVMSGVRARLQTYVDVELTYPKRVLQDGLINTVAGSPTVTLVPPSVNTFVNNPASEEIYLEILGTALAGEYKIQTKLASQLVLSQVLGITLNNVQYRIYTKQDAKFNLPITQLKSVTISDGGTGVKIPYADPIHISVASPASRLANPITYADFGACSVTGTTLSCTAPNSFLVHGLQQGDLVYIPEMIPLSQSPYFYIVNITGATTIQLDHAVVGGPIATTQLLIGSPTVSSTTLTFMDPTFFEAKNTSVVFTHTNAAGEVYDFEPSKNVEGYLYAPTALSTTFVVDPAVNTLVSAGTHDLHDMGVKTGDIFEIQSIVLDSGTFNAAEDANVDVGGAPNVGLSVLNVTVDGIVKPVFFSQINPSLTSVVSTLNQQLGADLYAERITVGANKQLRIFSRKHIVLANGVGSPLTHLKLTGATDNSPAGVGGEFSISAVAANGSSVTLSSGIGASGLSKSVLVRIKRLGTQYIYPANMTLQDNGLYTATIQVASKIPISFGKVLANAECVGSGYVSRYGYTFNVANPEYAFSIGEQLFLRVYNLVFPSTAVSLEEAIVVPKTTVAVEYENAPEISTLQQAMLRRSLRVTCNNPLIKYYQPAYPVIGIRYQGLEEVETVRTSLLNLIVRLYPNNPLEVYDVLAEIGKLRVDTVVGPLEVGYLTIDKNRTLRLFKSFDQVSIARSFHIMGELDYVVVTRG
jgi:uncharacterized phage protein gp47/JayE